MMVSNRIVTLSLSIMLIATGCYTTRQHPLVRYQDEYEMETLLMVDFKDQCQDCHTEVDTLNLVAASIPDLIQIHSYNSEYYSENSDLNLFYDEKPWWTDYDWSHTFARDNYEQEAIYVTLPERGGIPDPLPYIPLPVPAPPITQPTPSNPSTGKDRTNSGIETPTERSSGTGGNRNNDGGRSAGNGRR